MQINPECVKDILSVFESVVTKSGTTYTISSWYELMDFDPLRKYSVDEISYRCQQIYLSDYLYNGKMLAQGGISFMDITPNAHAFLANMRIPTVSKTIQKFITLVGSASLQQIASIASEAALNYLPQLLK